VTRSIAEEHGCVAGGDGDIIHFIDCYRWKERRGEEGEGEGGGIDVVVIIGC